MANSKKPKKPKAVPVVPPLGPPTNLRPAGAHGDKRRPPRGEQERAALREEDARELL